MRSQTLLTKDFLIPVVSLLVMLGALAGFAYNAGKVTNTVETLTFVVNNQSIAIEKQNEDIKKLTSIVDRLVGALSPNLSYVK